MENGDIIKAVFSVKREKKVVNGAGPVLHYFSITIVHSTPYYQLKETKQIASGLRFVSDVN